METARRLEKQVANKNSTVCGTNQRGGGLSKRIRSIGKRTENMIGFKTKIVEGLGPS